MGAGLASILTPEGSPRPGMGVGWGGSAGRQPRNAPLPACSPHSPRPYGCLPGRWLRLGSFSSPYLPKQTARASHPQHARPRDRKQAVTAPGPRLPRTRSRVSNPAPRRCDWLSAAQEAPRRSNGRPPEAAGSEVLHACGICSEGHDHFGQVFKCESAFGRSLGKIPSVLSGRVR